MAIIERKLLIPKRGCIVTGDALNGVTFELGMDLYMANQRIRLSNISWNKDKKKELLKYLKDLVCKKDNIYAEIQGKGKYGRWVASVYVRGENTICVNEELVRLGYANFFKK